MFWTLALSTASSERRAAMSTWSAWMSSTRSAYARCPAFNVDCCTLIFSYSPPSSSFRLISWVPSTSRSDKTVSYSFCCFSRSASASLMIMFSVKTSALNLASSASPLPTLFCTSAS